jgi:hypothetical protein
VRPRAHCVPSRGDHLADRARVATGTIACDHARSRHHEHCARPGNLDAQGIELSREDIQSINSIAPERTATQSLPSTPEPRSL